MQVLSTHPSDHRGTNALKRALADIDAPNWLVAYGDRKDMLEAVLEAHYRGVKIVHVGGGETRHSDAQFAHTVRGNVHPDHRTRDAISMLADVHLVANDRAAFNLQLLSILRMDVYVTGCPSLDEIVALSKTPAPERDGSVFEWFPETARTFTPTDWPRLSEAEFLQRLRTCSLFRTNSSAGLREAPILGTPVEMIGDRQKGRAPAGTYHHPGGRACEEIRRIVMEVCT